MSTLATLKQQIRNQLELPRYRHLPKVLALAAVLSIAAILAWLPGAKDRLAQQESKIGSALKTIQTDIAELERLKSRALPTKLAGSTLREAVTASLARQRPALSVELVDAAHVRVRGNADFDSAVRWIGDVQRSHRLGVASLSVNRQDAGVALDMTLSASRE